MGRVVVAVALLAGAAACTDEPQALQWDVRFENAALAGRTRIVRASVRRGGCLAASELYTADVPRRAAASMPPPMLGPGTYGLAALAIDDTCNVIGEGCEDVELPGPSSVTVTVSPRAEPEPAPGCVPGIGDAGTSDAGTGDAGAVEDAGAPDGGLPDTGPPDTGAPDAGGPLAPCPADDTLVLCLTFEGAVEDESGRMQMVSAAGVAFVPGVHGTAVALDEFSTIDVAADPSLSPSVRTVQAWVRPEAAMADVEIVEKDGEYGLGIDPAGHASCWRNSAAGTVTTSAPAPLVAAGWTHLACTYDGTTHRIYVDGEEAGVVRDANAAPAPMGTLAVGGDPAGGQRFAGEIDDVRVYARLLTAAELAAAAMP